jgi:formate dehydrogenase subunit gamma
MDAMTNQRLERFDGVERAVHWSTAILVGVCMFTAAALAIAPVSTLVGRRNLVRQVHVVSGLLLLVPLAFGVAGRWGSRLRADVRALNRFDALDRQWLRAAARARPGTRNRHAKFHPGQKLNAAASAAALVMLLATGVVLRWFEPFSLDVRQGSTFVHDWTAFLFTALVIAHVLRGVSDRGAMRGMLTGAVDADWAATKHPRWHVTPPEEAWPRPSQDAPPPSGAHSGRSSH